MNPHSIVLQALKKASPDERQVYLDAQCGVNTPLRTEVESLLSEFEQSVGAGGRGKKSDTRPIRRGAAATNEEMPAVAEAPSKPIAGAQPPGAMLGHYRVIEVLGKGGMGIVYLAEDQRLRRRVAVKAMLPGLAEDESLRLRFVREARAAAAVENDHVVPIYHVGEEDGIPFLVMPFLKGTPLDKWLDGNRQISIAETVRLGRDIARGLAAAHEQGLIHRDIKPANVWIEPDGRAKILDFGLARAVEEKGHLTSTGFIVGTPAYMAPEQARDEELDHRCDLFSLGSVLYRLCAGRPPFRGESAMALLTSLAVDNPQPIAGLNRNIPPALEALILQLLSKDRDQRPQSAQEVLRRLEIIERTQPNLSDTAIPPAAGAEPPPSNTPSHTVRQPSAEVMPPSEKAAPIRSKRRPLLIGGFSLLAVGAMVAVVLNLPRRQSPVEPPIEESKRPTAENKPPPEVKPPLPPTFANPLGMKFVLVPKGTGWLGGSNGKPGDEKVEIAQDFYLGTHEVTQEEWEKVMGSNPSQFSRSGEKRNSVTQVSDAELKRFPVENVSWPEAQDFVARLNERLPDARLGISSADSRSVGIRLPRWSASEQGRLRLHLLLRQADERGSRPRRRTTTTYTIALARLARTRRIRSGSTTCTAMSRSGVRTRGSALTGKPSAGYTWGATGTTRPVRPRRQG